MFTRWDGTRVETQRLNAELRILPARGRLYGESVGILLLDLSLGSGCFYGVRFIQWSKQKESENTDETWCRGNHTTAEWLCKVAVQGKNSFSRDVIPRRPLLIEDKAFTLSEMRLFMPRFSVEVRRRETTTACKPVRRGNVCYDKLFQYFDSLKQKSSGYLFKVPSLLSVEKWHRNKFGLKVEADICRKKSLKVNCTLSLIQTGKPFFKVWF